MQQTIPNCHNGKYLCLECFLCYYVGVYRVQGKVMYVLQPGATMLYSV